MLKIVAVSFLAIFIGFGAFSSGAASITFEAESGSLGSDFTNGTDGSVQFISISTDTVNSGNPGNASRVATYTVTFPAVGTYQLYARIRTGSDTFNDDSLFYGNGFGTQDPANNADWMLVNGLAGAGFNNSADVVTGGGTLGSGMWKWINLSQFTSQTGFTVNAGNLTQTFQIGGRENGLSLDKFVFGTAGYSFTVSNLDNGTDGTPPPPPSCTINWNDKQQHIDGFGFSSAWCGTLSAAKNKALYQTLGMSLLRIRIDENNNWSQEIANAAAAHSYGAKVFGCPWRAPAYMTYAATNYTTNSITMVITTNHFTYLSTNYFNAYALWLNQAAVAHNLDYVSIKNEPDLYASGDLNMSPEEIRIFCRSNAPAIGRPVTMADAVGFTDSVSDPTLNDPVAASHIAIVSGHFYGGGNRVHSNALAKGKAVWMTEHYLDGCVTNYAVCLNLAKEISDAMKNQFSAYVAWWAQDGDVNINLANTSGTILKDGYTMGQFAKFIRPGFYRIGTTNEGNGAEITAYKDLASSNYVIVAINHGSTVITQQFDLNGFPTAAVTPWLTSPTQSLAAQTPITGIGSSFTYSIQPSNIVTFVGTPPPLAPAGLAAMPGNGQVNLSWDAVTGASSYNVKRATVSGSETMMTNVAGTSFTDTNVVVGMTYYYVVSAVNISGESVNSAEASVTTVPFFTLSPVADAYVYDGSPAGNFGAANNLTVKDGASGLNRVTYLKFNVAGLSNVTSAKLTLTPMQVDGSVPLLYEQWSNDNWSETGITWNNQPAGTGTTITNISSYALWTPVMLDVTGMVKGRATNDGLLTIRIIEPGANAVRIDFCSKENSTNSYRPVLEYANPANTAPVLAAIANQTIGAGMTLNLTNVATDDDVPAQMLTFSLLAAPTNAVLDTNSGVLTWRPPVTQANTTNPFTVMVTDNGTPRLSATQSFVVTVNPLTQPQLSMAAMSEGQMMLQVNGDSGPDYQIQTSTNLVNWNSVFTTNSPAMPFNWTNSDLNLPMNFFRIQVGPPWP